MKSAYMPHRPRQAVMGIFRQCLEVHATNLKTSTFSYWTSGYVCMIIRLFIPSSVPFPEKFEFCQKFT